MLLAEKSPLKIEFVNPVAVFQVAVIIELAPEGHALGGDVPQRVNTTGPVESDMLSSM